MTDDPDNLATAAAAATLKRMLADRRHAMTDKEAWFVAFATINTWIQQRTCNWAVRRGTPRFGYPDAMTIGFTEAALPLIAQKLVDAGADLNCSVLEMAKTDAARMFAIAHEAIEASRIHTLEDPTIEEMPA